MTDSDSRQAKVALPILHMLKEREDSGDDKGKHRIGCCVSLVEA